MPTNVQQIDKVVAFFGPYRNLTTLTAGIYSLHPDVQVFNHGGVRIFGTEGYEGRPEIDWTDGYGREKFNKFIKFAILASKGENGQQGKYGGSITKSHAFFNPEIENNFYDRFPEAKKPEASTLVWKDSHRLTNRLGAMVELMEREERLNFLMPIRNPMDVVTSCAKFRFENFFGLEDGEEPWVILDMLFDVYERYFRLKEEYPSRFTHFYEFWPADEIINLLGYTGGLPEDERWSEEAQECWNVKPSYYDYSTKMIDKYIERLGDIPRSERPLFRRFMEEGE